MAEGQLVRHGVMTITGVRGRGDRMEAHMHHAWLMMRSHAQGETRVHLGELGVPEVGGDDDNGGGGGGRRRPFAGPALPRPAPPGPAPRPRLARPRPAPHRPARPCPAPPLGPARPRPSGHGPDRIGAGSQGGGGGSGGGGANPIAPSLWEKTVAAVWRIRLLHLSRTEAQYLTPHPVEGVPREAVWATMQQLKQLAAEGFVAMAGEGVELYGAICPLPKLLQHLYSCRPVKPVHVRQPGDARLHWMPIAVDGTSRHEASYVHCTIGGTSSPDQLASRWLLGGSEEWATLYVAAQEVDFDQQLWGASKVVFQDTNGSDRETLFFSLYRWRGTNFNGQLQELESRGSSSNGVLGMWVQ